MANPIARARATRRVAPTEILRGLGRVHSCYTAPMNPDSSAFNLNDRYIAADGTVIMSGLQALARLPLDQRRADLARGLNTAGLITGYRGSPVGALDTVLERIPDLLREHHIRFIPAVNEELAATAIMGSQTANQLPNPKYDGVCGIWYGKGPGRRPQRATLSSTPI